MRLKKIVRRNQLRHHLSQMRLHPRPKEWGFSRSCDKTSIIDALILCAPIA